MRELNQDAAGDGGFRPIGSVVWRGVESTIAAGAALAGLIAEPCVVALNGPMGAGKTHFTKGLAHGWCGIKVAEVRSPTFTLLHSYRGGGRVLHHIDLCRIEGSEEVPSDIADAMADARAVCAVEWAEMFPELLPSRVIVLEIAYGEDDDERVVKVRARGVEFDVIRAWLDAKGEACLAELKSE